MLRTRTTYNHSVTSALWNRILTVLAWAGVFVAGVLTAKHFMNLQLPCGYSQDCEKVANHPSSYWFGIPVALFGLLAYLTLAALAFIRSWKGLENTRNLANYGAIIAAVGVLVSLFLTGYSIAVIKATCPWCMSSAIIMLVTGFCYAGLLQAMSGERSEAELRAEKTAKSPFDLVLVGCCLVLTIGLVGWRVSTLKAAANVPTEAITNGLAGTPMMAIVRDEERLRGPKDAPITLVEYADFYCPTCREGYPKLRKIFMDSNGKIRMGFVHFPLYKKEGHELSLAAAIISEYAAKKGKYWQFVDAMFDAPIESISTRDGLLSLAGRIGLDEQDLLVKIQDQNDPMLDEVVKDLDMAATLGIQGTPTYLLYAAGAKPIAVAPSLLEMTLDSQPYYMLLHGETPGDKTPK